MAGKRDGVDLNMSDIDWESLELQKRMTATAFQVLQMRVQVKGDFLQASLDDLHEGVRNTDTMSVVFAHPLASLSKFPVQVLVLSIGLFFIRQAIEGFTPTHFETRLIRFTTLETREPTVVGVGISKLSLLLGRNPDDPLHPGIRSGFRV